MRLLSYCTCSLKKNVLNTNDSQEKLSKAKQFKYDTIAAEIIKYNIIHIAKSNEQSKHKWREL